MDKTKYIVNEMKNVENVDFRLYLMNFHSRLIKSVLLSTIKVGLWITERDIDFYAQKCATQEIDLLDTKAIPIQFIRLFDSCFKKKEQKKMLNGISITPEQLFAIFLYANKKGYKFSNYKVYIPQKKYPEKELPALVHILPNNEVKHIGETKLTNGQLKEAVESDNCIIARFLDNGKHWHCFVQTQRGILGKEPGHFGSQSHLHYISDAFGKSREDIVNDITNGIYMTSQVHILLKGYSTK